MRSDRVQSERVPEVHSCFEHRHDLKAAVREETLRLGRVFGHHKLHSLADSNNWHWWRYLLRVHCCASGYRDWILSVLYGCTRPRSTITYNSHAQPPGDKVPSQRTPM